MSKKDLAASAASATMGMFPQENTEEKAPELKEEQPAAKEENKPKKTASAAASKRKTVKKASTKSKQEETGSGSEKKDTKQKRPHLNLDISETIKYLQVMSEVNNTSMSKLINDLIIKEWKANSKSYVSQYEALRKEELENLRKTL